MAQNDVEQFPFDTKVDFLTYMIRSLMMPPAPQELSLIKTTKHNRVNGPLTQPPPIPPPLPKNQLAGGPTFSERSLCHPCIVQESDKRFHF